jgi:glycosyltransferase involved in cell wall biosynthesis
MQKKISVVIPTYKRLDLLLNCLNALNKQTIPLCDYEVIVVADGPDYNTAEILSLWQHTSKMDLRFLYTPTRKGPAAARNLGWLSARAKLIAFTDDDCLPDRNWLRIILEAYHNEDLVAFTGKTIVPMSKKPTDYELNISHLATADFITANCVCTKNALISVGGFDEAFKMAWREDSDLEFKLLQHQIPIHRIETAVVVHPIRKAKWGVSIKDQKKSLYDVLLFKKYPQLYDQKIRSGGIFDYYVICGAWLMALIFLLLGIVAGAKVAVILLLFGVVKFAYRRLAPTRKTFGHVLEMVVTSIAIPFVSLYWRFYGSIKFKKLLI